MPSEPALELAQRAVRPSMDRFRSVVAKTAEQIRGMLEAYSDATPGGSHLAEELGAFAATRIDPVRYSALFANEAVLDPELIGRVEEAHRVLVDIVGGGSERHVVRLGDGQSVYDAAASRLRGLGSAFGAARTVELTRTRRFDPTLHADLLLGIPFRAWTVVERRVAPPLIIMAEAAQVSASPLAELLDGSVKIVLVLSGPSPPAPLARLITPNTFVWQGTADDSMDGFGNWDGPAVAAVVSEGAARFTADPRRRDGAGLHLDVRTFPDDGVEFPRGVLSADQQREDLLHLAALRNASTPIPEGEAAVANPADKLAAWLLRQAMPSGG